MVVSRTAGSFPTRRSDSGGARRTPTLQLPLDRPTAPLRRDRLAGAGERSHCPGAWAAGVRPDHRCGVPCRLTQVIYSVGEQGALPLVVHVSQVPEAVIRNQARSEAAMLAGPPLGGVLFGLARALPFIANAISYVMSALGVLLVQTPLQEPRTAHRRGAVTEIVEGLRWFWSQSFLRTSALAVAAANFTAIALELVLIIRARLGRGGALAPARPYSRSLCLGAMTAVAGVIGPAWNAVVVGARLTLSPDHLRGRVNGVARLISGSLLALGPLAAGLLSQSVGTTSALLVLAGWHLLLALAATVSKSLRSGLPEIKCPAQDRRPGPANEATRI